MERNYPHLEENMSIMSIIAFKKTLFYIRIQLINNLVLVSGVHKKVIQLYMYLFFFKFLFPLGYYKILSRVPCSIL